MNRQYHVDNNHILLHEDHNIFDTESINRSMSVDRIFVIADILNIDSEIIHIAINILDMYVKDWNCPNIQIICICCIKIAIKFYSDNIIGLTYKKLSYYVSQYSPIKCFVKTEEAILVKIDYMIPLITMATHTLEFISCLDLEKSYNRKLRFNIMYMMDYLLFYPELYYINKFIKSKSYTHKYNVLLISVILIINFTVKKKRSIYDDRYPGIETYYRQRYKVLTSKRYSGMIMLS